MRTSCRFDSSSRLFPVPAAYAAYRLAVPAAHHIFADGLARKWSRVVEVDPRTGRIVWEYRASEPESFFSGALGGVRSTTSDASDG